MFAQTNRHYQNEVMHWWILSRIPPVAGQFVSRGFIFMCSQFSSCVRYDSREAGKHLCSALQTDTEEKHLFTYFPHWKLSQGSRDISKSWEFWKSLEKSDTVHIFSGSYPPGAKRTRVSAATGADVWSDTSAAVETLLFTMSWEITEQKLQIRKVRGDTGRGRQF